VNYSQVLNAVEINSSFYREHKPETYAKWAASVPDDFLFSAKLLRYFTQEKRLKETGGRLEEVISEMSHLGKKWGVLLVQLPPSLSFVRSDADSFLNGLRKTYSGLIAWEPRHLSWSSEEALNLLASYQVHKVLADPEPVFVTRSQRAPVERQLLYYRLHGSPEIYKSRYSQELIQRISLRMQQACNRGQQAWCIFDNTTFGYATENALALREEFKRDSINSDQHR
jgi:uncharacterized protein YecE (DUF72 family)